MEAEEESPSKKSGQARRPMNAFLIFCKRHRSLVREKNPHLDNRSVTRILGELWAKLSMEEKASYTSLANEYKEAFMKANPDYKWFNTDKSHPVRDGKPSTRPTNSLVAYHGEIPRSEAHEPSAGQYHPVSQPASTYSSSFKPPHSGASQPITVSRTTVPIVQHQQGQGIIDLSRKVPPNTSIDGQVSMAAELMKCVSQANNYSRLSQQPNVPASMATAEGSTAIKDNKTNDKDYGNVSLLHLAKMCSDELENSKPTGKTEVQPSMLTPPWTPQYDQSYSPPRVETSTATEPQPVKESKDKENLPNNMQNGMTFKEFKQKQNGTSAKAEHFKSLILSTDSEVTSCGKLVVDRVIESIYSQEFGKIEPKPEARPKTTVVSSTYTPQQLQNQNGTKPSDKLSGLFSSPPQQRGQNGISVKSESVPEAKDGGKMTMTFGQIQETLIRKAVENSYDFDIVSGLKSENMAYLHDLKDREKKDRADYSVFDFPSSDVGQNLVEMSSFESRIKSKKFDSSKSAFSTGSAVATGSSKPSYTQTSAAGPLTQAATSANRLTPSSRGPGASPVTSYPAIFPNKGYGLYTNKTAMELLQKCDELAKIGDNNNKTKQQTVQSAKVSADWGPARSSNQQTSPAAAHKSPPVPLKKRKFHLPIEPVEEKPVVANKSNERTMSVESLTQDENSRDSNDSTETRKSKRSNRGQRYKALMKQGVLQGSREKPRKNSNCSEASTPSNEGSPTPPNILPVSSTEPPPPPPAPPVQTSAAPPVNSDDVIVPRPIRKRTYSEVNTTFTTPSRVRRYTTGDFDLEAHIASLPIVDIDGVGKKNVSRPKPKPKIRHHSESSVLSHQQTSHCAPVNSQSLLSSMTPLCPGSTNNTDKMINVAELNKVIRQRSSSGNSNTGRERSYSSGSQSGSAAKRKARKRAITHLIPVTTPQVTNGSGDVVDSKKADNSISVSSTSAEACSLPASSTSVSSEGQNRHALTCP